MGDTDQCLPPGTLVSTPVGPRPIEELHEGDEVLGTAGRSSRCRRPGHDGCAWSLHGPCVRVRADGRELRGTPHHIVLARQVLDPGRFIVYLMHRADRGYRIGDQTCVDDV